MCCCLQLMWQFRFFFFLFEGGEIGRYKRAWWPFCDSERTLKYHFDSHASQNVSGLYVPINKTDLNFQHLAEAFFILTQFSQESSFRVLLLPYSSCELWRVFSHGCFLGGVEGFFFFPFWFVQWNASLRRGKQTSQIIREIAGWLLSLPPYWRRSTCHATSPSLRHEHCLHLATNTSVSCVTAWRRDLS